MSVKFTEKGAEKIRIERSRHFERSVKQLSGRTLYDLESTYTIKTGASLIPDLNVIVERMRNMPDDRFIYLNYMLPKTSEYFTPYSLKEFTYDDLPNKQLFFTMSRHGVTYWHLSENFFTPLLQWQQEFQQFLSIIKIRTFAVFRIWKGFKVWEKTIKWIKQGEAKSYLQDHLLIAIPPLASAILKLLEACLTAITERGFFPDDEINYYPSIKKMRDAMSFMDRARKRNFCKILSKYESLHLAHDQPTILTDFDFVPLLASLATAIVLCIICYSELHVTVSTIS
uniref:Uncharacterized protein n=1 Tax=Glossina pallidipes TaxID=7398 RepID=A0A1B0A5H7_GLOPL